MRPPRGSGWREHRVARCRDSTLPRACRPFGRGPARNGRHTQGGTHWSTQQGLEHWTNQRLIISSFGRNRRKRRGEPSVWSRLPWTYAAGVDGAPPLDTSRRHQGIATKGDARRCERLSSAAGGVKDSGLGPPRGPQLNELVLPAEDVQRVVHADLRHSRRAVSACNHLVRRGHSKVCCAVSGLMSESSKE